MAIRIPQLPSISEVSDSDYIPIFDVSEDTLTKVLVSEFSPQSASSDIPYGVCSNTESTVNKIVTVNSTFTLESGAQALVTFTNGNTASGVTLNINQTGPKPIYYKGNAVASYNIQANNTFLLVYDGTNFVIVGDAENGTVLVEPPIVTVGTYSYTGQPQGPTVSGADLMYCTLSGATAIDVGTYTLTVSLANPSRMKWSDLTTAPKTYQYTIDKAVLTPPSVSGTSLIYTGQSQGPTISSYDHNLIAVSGNTATNAGNYTLEFSLVDSVNTEWASGAVTQYAWEIATAQRIITATPSSVALDATTLYQDVTIEYTQGSGTFTVTSSDSTIATVENIQGNVYRISAVSSGATSVVASSVADPNYQDTSTTIGVSIMLPQSDLNDNDWATISAVSASGQASAYWDVGDAKEIIINGNVGYDASYDNVAVEVFILGFDHNSEIEGSGITFGCFRDPTTHKDFMLTNYNNYGYHYYQGRNYFNMNHMGTSQGGQAWGGWSACDLRYDVLGSTDTAPENHCLSKQEGNVGYDASSECATNPVSGTLMAALPSDLRSVMKPITKYSNNVGAGSSLKSTAAATATIDYLPLMSPIELFGSASSGADKSLDSESNYEVQYQYFINGNSKIRWRQHDLTKAGKYNTRCPNVYSSTATTLWNYFSVANDGTGNQVINYASCTYSYGLCPVFLV